MSLRQRGWSHIRSFNKGPSNWDIQVNLIVTAEAEFKALVTLWHV